jgi:hypothetical protein
MSKKYEVGDGWHQIIDDAIDLINRYIESRFSHSKLKNERKHPTGGWMYSHEKCPVKPELLIFQIKEKTGGLCIYTGVEDHKEDLPEEFDKEDYNNKIETLCGFIEGAKSYAIMLADKTCEFTGKPGVKVSNGYWIKTLSPEAAKEKGYDHPENSDQNESS